MVFMTFKKITVIRKFIEVFGLIEKILNNAAVVMIPGFPLSAEIRHDLENDFPQQFPG